MAGDRPLADVMVWWNDAHPGRHISAPTISKYKTHKRESGSYFTPATRGPKALLNPEELKRLLNLTGMTRKFGWAITANRFASLARGMVVKMRRDTNSVQPIPGVQVFSASWAKSTMEANGMRVRTATTDRTVPLADVITEGRAWWTALEVLKGTDPRLVLNVDEFFVKLDDQHRWTWARCKKGEKLQVVVKDEKLGFTCSALSSLDGELVALQQIWKGETSAVHARVSPEEENPRIWQMHQPASHFQNAATWKLFMERFVAVMGPVRAKVIAERKQSVPAPPTSTASTTSAAPVPTRIDQSTQTPASLLSVELVKEMMRDPKILDEGVVEKYLLSNHREATAAPPAPPAPVVEAEEAVVECCVYLLIDQAPQHTEVAIPSWIKFLYIPKSLTHLFQPADQFVISCLKRHSVSGYHDWVKEQVQGYDDATAAKILAGKIAPPGENGGAAAWGKLPYKRYIKYRCLSGAVEKLGREAVQQSWGMVGVHRVMGLPQPIQGNGKEVPVVWDDYLQLWDEERRGDLLLKEAEAVEGSTEGREIAEGLPAARGPPPVHRTDAPHQVKPAAKPATKPAAKPAVKPQPKGRPSTKSKPPPKGQRTLFSMVTPVNPPAAPTALVLNPPVTPVNPLAAPTALVLNPPVTPVNPLAAPTALVLNPPVTPVGAKRSAPEPVDGEGTATKKARTGTHHFSLPELNCNATFSPTDSQS